MVLPSAALKVAVLPAAAVDAAMDEREFTAFYEHTAPALRAYLRGSCGNPALADDLLQESFLRLLRAKVEVADERHRRNYLFRIASNLLTDHWRRRRELQVEAEDGSGDSHESAVQHRSDVAGALGELGVRDRQMLWFAYVEGSTHTEIAAALGLKAASIRSMLHRARGRLAAAMRRRGLGPVWRGES